MKILKINCPITDGITDSGKCHDDLKISNPNMISVLHEPNNHILIMKDDYDNNGHVKLSAVIKSEEGKLDVSFKPIFDEIKNKEFS